MRPVSGTVKDMTESGARSPRLLRRLNAQTLLRHALTTGDFAAAEAMRASGLSRATVLGVCDELVAAGWLEEIADSRLGGQYQRGRPARRYRLREEAGVLVGVDAGESRFDVAVADLRGTVLAQRHREADPGEVDLDGRRDLVRSLVEEALADPAVQGVPPLVTVIGVPAPVDADGASPEDNSAFWSLMNPGVDPGIPGLVLRENDANLAALAEHARRPEQHVATLLTGERFGAGLVVDGRLLHGRRGGAGEMRFLDLLAADDPDAGPSDGLGALARRWARGELERSAEPSALRDLDPGRLDAPEVFAAAAAGDALAERIQRRLGERLAHVAVVLASVLDVERIVVAGGIAEAIGPVLAHARTVLEADFYPPHPELVASTLGRDVIVQGALEMGLRRIREDPLTLDPGGQSVEVTPSE